MVDYNSDLCSPVLFCQGVDKLPVALDACFAFLQRALQSLELLEQCEVAACHMLPNTGNPKP